jgi:His/Glu/Gln/Arg/opine family amino acid ABC transporter permease subunit
VDPIFGHLDRFAAGVWVTVELTAISFALAMALGMVAAVARLSPAAPLRWAAAVYTELMRCTPPLALVVIFVFGLPKIGFMYSLFTSSALALGIYTGAFVGEAIRSGIRSVPIGQIEAARALGMGFAKVMRHVVLPQALRTVVPPLGNLFITQIKATSIAASVGVLDITGAARKLNFETAQAIPVFLGAMAAYMLLTLPAGALVARIERRTAIVR